MKKLLKLLTAIVGCQLVGILGSVFTVNAIPTWYSSLTKPFFAPPDWLFAPVWTILYLMMGVSFYLIWKKGWEKSYNRIARNYFFAQLALNFVWSPAFFGLKSPLLALLIIVVLLGLIIITIKKFFPISKWSAILLLPYLLWVTFATVLNGAIVLLN